jgi:predicted AlkP superfamily phosphohydrolase/phosphomutase/tetratricopeptide (TPR) repeat protein
MSIRVLPMSRASRPVLWIATGLLVAGASVIRVPAGSVGLLAWRGGGTPTLLAPGFSLRVPLLQRFYLYPGGAIEAQASVTAASRDGSEVSLPFKVVTHPNAQDLLTLHQEGGGGGARQALKALAEEQIRKTAAGLSTFDLASGRAAGEIQAGVRTALEKRLGTAVTVDLATPALSPQLRAAFDPKGIYGKRQETAIRILLIGIDSGDWDVIDPLIARGELPNLARLKKEGSWARLRSNVPTLSPILWTTVVTGKTPDKHGINDFLVMDPHTGRKVPINSTFRRTKALWNIASEAGLDTDFVAWWASWPAEAIKGHLISDRVAYSTFSFADTQGSRRTVYPDDYAPVVERLRVGEEAITYRQVARFLHIGENEFRRARSVAASKGKQNETQESINVFTRVLASTETYRRVALDILESESRSSTPARLFAAYFQGVDETNHRFAHCSPPRAPLCSAPDYARFKDAIASFYGYQDEILGEILTRAPGSTVLVLSDHGFATGSNRPKTTKPFIEGGNPGLWHELFGIFVAAGPAIRPGELPVVTLYDIAPTVLHLLGLPVPEDMPGKVPEGVLTPEFEAGHAIARVPSYEGLAADGEQPAGALASGSGPAGDRAAPVQGEALNGPGDEEMVAQLRSLGYVGGGKTGNAAPSTATPGGAAPAPSPAGSSGPGSAGIPTILFHNNLARVYLQKRQYDQAEAEYRKALRIDPSSIQALAGLVVLQEAQGHPEKALETVQSMVRLSAPDEAAPLIKMAELFAQIGRADDGVAFVESLRPQKTGDRRWEVSHGIALGILYGAAGRGGDAEAALRKVLALEPNSVSAMQELFALYDSQQRAQALEPMIRAALARDPRSSMHHNWLGLILRRRGDLKGAEAELHTAAELAPDLVGILANLGSLYLQENRPKEAIAILTKALEKDPRNVESRTNLIVALGMAHDLEGAGSRVAEAKTMGQRVPLFYNALAYAFYINGQSEKALAALRESLQIDPRQSDARRLQAEIEHGQPAAGSPYR